jgi:hypothetical protein
MLMESPQGISAKILYMTCIPIELGPEFLDALSTAATSWIWDLNGEFWFQPFLLRFSPWIYILDAHIKVVHGNSVLSHASVHRQ